ncbi:DUF1851 domain-containing protein [Pseudoduganella sp. FT26W]|uniref:DUF1851 domain-containing protein n=1 Tax=Duganella aquatilis TaxID=2666082 RepID=A0A844DAC2_9BURK|nr:T6SS immunity protein Tdi1 domain-containing protein [Duganella aquatilis]MRW87165.1 DUF1851 domain-containing protein [Duganella aquatilis]
MPLITEISRAWGRYWRITPEEGMCEVVADDRASFEVLLRAQEFLHDWYMCELVEVARKHLGELAPPRKYCLKVPGYLGGAYDMPNLATAPIHEIIGMAGDLARQTYEPPSAPLLCDC